MIKAIKKIGAKRLSMYAVALVVTFIGFNLIDLGYAIGCSFAVLVGIINGELMSRFT